MSSMYLRLEIRRALRDPKFLALGVAAPVGFYLLFSSIFGGQHRPGQLDAETEIMVAMAAFGAMWAVLSSTGPRIAEERQNGWATQLSAMPIRSSSVLVAKLVSAVLVALP
nr:ABC transporter permease [Acidobacteriota bacterium]